MELREIIFGQLTNRCQLPKVESFYSQIAMGKGLRLNPNTEAVDVGTYIFEEYPIGATAIAFFDVQDKYCNNCVTPIESAIQCPNLCGEHYCSLNCLERANILYHSILCSARNKNFLKYSSIARRSSNEYYIVAARLLAVFPNAPWLYHYHCPDWTDLKHLSARSDLRAETVEMTVLLRNALSSIKYHEPELITVERLSKTMGMLRVNALGLRFTDDTVGFAMYATQSLANHSEHPNCRCVSMSSSSDSGVPCLCGVEAIKRIEPGDELFIDYVVGMKKASFERSSTLKLQYGIHETCINTDNS